MSPWTILLLGLLPPTIAGTGARTRLQLDVEPVLQLDGSSDRAVSAGTALALAATWFVRPVLDDATPPALQPYLQRTSTVSLRLRGGFGGADDVLGAGLGAAADIYLTRRIAFTAAVDAQLTHAFAAGVTDDGFSRWRAAAGIALRAGDLRLDAGYRYAPGVTFDDLPERAGLRGGGAIAIGMRAVLIERIDLQLAVDTSLAGDVVGRFSTDYYPARRLGLLWGIVFGHGVYSRLPTAAVEDLFGARFGVAWWFGPRVALTARFAPAWHFLSGGRGTVEQRVTVNISTRL